MGGMSIFSAGGCGSAGRGTGRPSRVRVRTAWQVAIISLGVNSGVWVVAPNRENPPSGFWT
ncbi:MAG: hypothetical protein A2Z86_12495 [Candidatus Glassbacteria bacterium GWA2_58_10]|uniref:Uncharacterized protein n=1 Tax=Candidatus Glassbacteria bacterium GWA2_58_10 TaxID=1817865 RepID=A0A1F5YDM8_9BACT|nr:MAG: hypothetical protein A2Z86_12495 [Candidatus Glassbacteria bacterium GWA2_58_10]